MSRSAGFMSTTGKAVKPAKPIIITIKGKGTIPVYGDGAMRRLPKGEPVEVSAAERAFLKRAKVI